MRSLAALWIFAALTLSVIASVIPLQNMRRDPDAVYGAGVVSLFDREARTPRNIDFGPPEFKPQPPLIQIFGTLASSIMKPGNELASLTTEYCTLEESKGIFDEMASARMNAYNEIGIRLGMFGQPEFNRLLFRDPNNHNKSLTRDQLSALFASVFDQTIIPVAEHIRRVCPGDSFGSKEMKSLLSDFIALLRRINLAAPSPSPYDPVIRKYIAYLKKVGGPLMPPQRRFFMTDRGATSIRSAIRRSA